MKRQRLTAKQAKRRTAADDDPLPKSPDEFRLELARRIHTFLGDWRRCRLALCKRTRACRGRAFACREGWRPATPAQTARAVAKMQRLIQRRLDQLKRAPADSDPGSVAQGRDAARRKAAR